MPAISTITVNDGATDHSFSPRGVDNSGVATLIESTGVPIGDRRLTVGRSRTAQGREKSTLKFVLPVVQDVVVSGVSRPTQVRSAYVDLTFSFDSTSSTAERGAALALTADLLSDSAIIAVVRDLQNMY